MKTNITSIADPNYEAITKFIEQVSLLNTLIAGPKPDQKTETKTNVPGPNPGGAKSIQQASGKEILEAHIIVSPVLAAWSYQMLKNADFDCLADFDRLVRSIYSVDSSFYSKQKGESEYLTFFTKSFGKLQTEELASNYLSAYAQFETSINGLEERSQKHKEHIKTLSDFNEAISKAGNAPAAKSYCDNLVAYTRGEIDKFLIEAGSIQKGRVALIKAAKSLIDELKVFNSSIDKDESGIADNAFLITRVLVDGSKIQTVNLSYEKQKITVKNNEIIMEDIPAEKIEGSIKIRAYRTILAELSTGVFYTNLRFPKYGITESDSVLKVSQAGEDHYPVVAATHINLIPNIFDGDVHPLIQLGVGTGKDLPSFLGGVGIRFTGKVKCSISGGAIMTWRKELTKLKIGDTVKGTSELEEDLQYEFMNKPSLYLGFQVNF